jgi:hypothetical protein
MRTLAIAQQRRRQSRARGGRSAEHLASSAAPCDVEAANGIRQRCRLPTCEPGLAGWLRPDEYAHYGCGHAKEAGEMCHVKATSGPWYPRAADIGKSVEPC